MSILTKVASNDNLKTQQEGEYNLQLGETCEQILADYLTANGLPTYRACQRFVKSKVLKSRRSLWKECLEDGDYKELRCDLAVSGRDHHWRQVLKPNFIPHPTYKVLAGDPAMDKSLLRSHQRDLLVKISSVKRLSVEVKALTATAFDRAYIQVGCCPKWDEKKGKFKVNAIVIINQDTGEAFVASGDKSEMTRQKSCNRDGTDSYAVERSKLTPLDAWIDAIKDIYHLS